MICYDATIQNVELTPLNLRRLLCCAAQYHPALEGCEWGDIFRYNDSGDRLYPNLYIPIAEIKEAYYPHVDTTSPARARLEFEFYILDRDGKLYPNTTRDNAIAKAHGIAREIVAKLKNDGWQAGWMFDDFATITIIDDDANTEYFADDTTGVKVRWGVTAHVDECGTLWDCGNLFQCCVCVASEPRPEPEPVNPCCETLLAILDLANNVLLVLSPAFDPDSVECRAQVSRYIIRQDGEIVLDSPALNSIENPAPGLYQGEIFLDSGCSKLSNEVIVA